MAEDTGPIASAVILPDPTPFSKRRQSSASDSNHKRPRYSRDGSAASPPALRESPQPIDSFNDLRSETAKNGVSDRRKSSVQEEKKRGQRLFGGLLSTLSQSTPNGQQKRRLEIEKRQQEKAKQQKIADEVRRAEKLASLKSVRKIEQVKFEEESMRIRHSNMRAMANFLSTKTEPKIYYKPWELLPQHEERIKTQIAEAEALIEQEVTEFYARHPKQASQEITEADTNDTSKETVGEPLTESPSVSNVVDTTNVSAQVHQSDEEVAEKREQEEHNGEVVVENEEDTVIY